MLEKINERINKEIEKIMNKEDLSLEEIRFLMSIKSDIEYNNRLNLIYSRKLV